MFMPEYLYRDYDLDGTVGNIGLSSFMKVYAMGL